MNNRLLIVGIALLTLGATVMIWNSAKPREEQKHEVSTEHPVTSAPARVPAYQSKVIVQQLAPTLMPVNFVGKAREGYEAAKAIPEILAQLPCYCHCDQSLNHKSLHSCFETDHASHCAVCIDEALLAYKLQKDDKLTPEQIRQTIIAKYSE